MKEVNLEEVIRSNIPLPPQPNGRGFYSVLCKVCNDHGKKGPRAGFKFDEKTVGYNCFNCGHKSLYDPYDPESDGSMPDTMIKILDAFNIPDDEWKQVLLSGMAFNGRKVKPKEQYIEIEPAEIELPKHFYPLVEDDTDKWSIIARDYLEHDRGIDPDKHRFFLSTGKADTKYTKWKGRVIIPIYKDDKLVHYQGRSLIKMKLKYLSPTTPKDKIIYGYDKLFKNPDLPLYVVEGYFDAVSIDGVAMFGNQLTKEQIKWLNRSQRPKVVIPDRLGDGHLLANQAVKLGWSVGFPDIGSCKDMNEAVNRFGKLYVMKSIANNTHSEFAAQTAIGMFCKNAKK